MTYSIILDVKNETGKNEPGVTKSVLKIQAGKQGVVSRIVENGLLS